MTRFVGVDAHKRFLQVCILDEGGSCLGRVRVACQREALQELAQKVLQSTDRVVLEATTNTWALVDLLAPFVAQVVVSNPLRTRAIASAKIKTDTIDARVLAELLRSGFLPEVWQPDAETRRRRALTHRRASLVGDRTAVKNRLHATLASRLIEVPFDDLFGRRGRGWLETLDLDPDGRHALDSDLRLLDALEAEIGKLHHQLDTEAYRSDAVRLLLTLPGFEVAVAQGLLAAWGDVSRFPDADHAAGYLGLVPKTRQSASHCYHGPITKQGNSHARWLLVQAAQHLDSRPGPLGVFFRRLAKKKGRNVAVVAGAHKLALVAWHMLRRGEPYRYAQPLTTQNKLARLRVRATGRRRQGGLPKGSPRPAAYGTGQGTRKIPSLGEVYAVEALASATPLGQLPPGEQQHLRTTHTLAFVQQIQQAQRRARRQRKRNPSDPASTSPPARAQAHGT
jgi:transposase